jgi:hypothetical protein
MVSVVRALGKVMAAHAFAFSAEGWGEKKVWMGSMLQGGAVYVLFALLTCAGLGVAGLLPEGGWKRDMLIGAGDASDGGGEV